MIVDVKDKWSKELNQQQLEAVTHGDGSLLVVAGAGSGKMRTLAYVYAISPAVAILPDGTSTMLPFVLNREIIGEGYGSVNVSRPFKHMGDYVKLQGEALAARKGVWAISSIETGLPSGTMYKPVVITDEDTEYYHRTDCPETRGRKTMMELSYAEAEGYKPCPKCSPWQNDSDE